MAEYIKREDAKKAILDACGCDCRCMAGTWCNGECEIHAGSVWGAVDNIPAADVRENVRGEWVDDGFLNRKTCSVCGTWIANNTGTAKPNYCPNCAAKMEQVP